jgi:hypothetical protein
MGLLDDAIREHLELKRRNGADPGEVAREQQEALDPVFPGASAASHDDVALEDVAGDDGEVAAGAAAPEQAPSVADTAPAAGQDAPAIADPSSPGQETVELDMESVLHADAEDPGPASAAGPAFDGQGSDVAAYKPEAEPLEWEMPGEGSHTPDEHLADARRESASEEWDRAEHPGDAEARADVPRELPGQERLSFE